ncbi:heptosyltransferase-1 [Litorivivens lipolytica]|uniref:Lipopolysaccharide heptosyltransferase 1 n=1 Tax=Litorivivens lipolytica TaxID=1524264 RepID=A0A7W4W4I6_9GAMM|nr:lipopolysaccharide heptosyltransferase RfaC [Litorivivens lipolytica]MBB3047318.1 heptosyltransferase-1 [Litorivivens lipolytica]
MRVLIIKTSSMGDVVHTLPALTDAAAAIPGIVFDWVVEEGFAEIPGWHPAVDKVIPVAIRRWRKSPLAAVKGIEWKAFKTQIRKENYDLVIDAQGLLKSAILMRLVKAPRAGMDSETVREKIAAWFYHRKFHIPREQHAVERTRQLFAAALNYDRPTSRGDYAIDCSKFKLGGEREPYAVFLHGTTRHDKHWPETYWLELCKQAVDAGYEIRLPWGSDAERERAQRLAALTDQVKVLPRLNLQGVAAELQYANFVVSVDTGLGHLAAALNRPTVALYGPTSPDLVGTYGANQCHLLAGDFPRGELPATDPVVMTSLTPRRVWQALTALLKESA